MIHLLPLAVLAYALIQLAIAQRILKDITSDHHAFPSDLKEDE